MEKASDKIREIKEISVAIDTWDDIFSDFDPGPLESRLFSEDFIAELKKRHRETKSGKLSVFLCAPLSLKDERAEKIVTQRLKREFAHKYLQRKIALRKMRVRGAIFACFGILFLSAVTFITYYKLLGGLAVELIGTILIPLGWFTIWEGFSKLMDASPISEQEEQLFSKLSKADYVFKYIGEETGK